MLFGLFGLPPLTRIGFVGKVCTRRLNSNTVDLLNIFQTVCFRLRPNSTTKSLNCEVFLYETILFDPAMQFVYSGTRSTFITRTIDGEKKWKHEKHIQRKSTVHHTNGYKCAHANTPEHNKTKNRKNINSNTARMKQANFVGRQFFSGNFHSLQTRQNFGFSYEHNWTIWRLTTAHEQQRKWLARAGTIVVKHVQIYCNL